MTIKEANNQINRIDNEIEYYLKKKELEMSKMMPQATKYDKTLVDGYMQDPIFADYQIEPSDFWEKVNSRPKELAKQAITITDKMVEKEKINMLNMLSKTNC